MTVSDLSAHAFNCYDNAIEQWAAARFPEASERLEYV